MPFDELSEEQVQQILEEYQGHPVTLEMYIPELAVLIQTLRLALLHPHFPETPRLFLDAWIAHVSQTVGHLSFELERLFHHSLEPSQDVPIKERQPRAGPAPSLELLIYPTDQLTKLDGVLCRVWHAETDEGVRCLAFIRSIAVMPGEDSTAFDRALLAGLPPGHLTEFHEVLKHG